MSRWFGRGRFPWALPLAAGAWALSFDALSKAALDSGYVGASQWKAAVWALIIDYSVWVGYVGLRRDHTSKRSWALLGAGSAATVYFQAHWGSAASWVPPVALLLALWVLEREQPPAGQEPAQESTPLPPGQRLALVDERDPSKTLEMLPAAALPSVVIHNDIHSQAAALSTARADADTAVSTQQQHADSGAEPGVDRQHPAVDSAADDTRPHGAVNAEVLTVRARVQAAVSGLSAHELDRVNRKELAARIGANPSTVRAEVARIRGNHDRS